ncbi:hypothetical protein [Rugamonas rubra]|uniref:hypothetical protein n=1 Tax=Rugamonas rubra TaxID=758825 RepID=UPI00111425FA|nr:hypothetical protein [Rugamonas rubra]
MLYTFLPIAKTLSIFVKMKRLISYIIVILGIFPLIGCSTPRISSVNASSPTLLHENENINGEWEGLLTFQEGILSVKDPAFRTLQYRLVLGSSEAQVFAKNTISGVWEEAMPQLFRVSRTGSNAVLQATDSGKDEDGTWVETWIFVLTNRSTEELQVEFVRMVNNIDLPISVPGKVFSYGGSGKFVKLRGR